MARKNADPIDYETLKPFLTNSVTGWINLKSQVYQTALFNHLSFFEERPDVIPHIADSVTQLKNGCPEKSTLMPRVIDQIYAEGWGRIGTFGGDKIELDCATEHLKELRRIANKISRALNRTLVCMVTEPEQNPRRKRTAISSEKLWTAWRRGYCGWISPNKEIFESDPTEPFEIFEKNPLLPPEVANVLKRMVSEDQLRQTEEFEAELDPDQHPEWQRFYYAPFCPSGYDRFEIDAVLMAAGWGSMHAVNDTIMVVRCATAFTAGLCQAVEATADKIGWKVETRSLMDLDTAKMLQGADIPEQAMQVLDLENFAVMTFPVK